MAVAAGGGLKAQGGALLPHPTTEWDQLGGSVFYRRSTIYASLSWPLRSLADHILAAAPQGGYVALYRDRSRLASVSHAQPASLLRPNIQVYTPAGRLIETLPCDPTRKIVAIGWTPAEQLAVVLDDGVVRIYTLFATAPESSSTSGPSSSGAGASGGLGPALGGGGSAQGAAGTASGSGASAPVPVTSTCYFVPYTLGQEAADTGIVDAQIYNPSPTAFVNLPAHRPSLSTLDDTPPLPPDVNTASGAGVVALTGAGTFLYWPFPRNPLYPAQPAHTSARTVAAQPESSSMTGSYHKSVAGEGGVGLGLVGDAGREAFSGSVVHVLRAAESFAPPTVASWSLIPPPSSTISSTPSGSRPPPTILISPAFSPSLLSLTPPASLDGNAASLAEPAPYSLNGIDPAPTADLVDLQLSRGPFFAIRPSPNGNLLALLTSGDDPTDPTSTAGSGSQASRKLWVVSSDLQRSLSEFDILASDAYQVASRVDGGLLDTASSTLGFEDKGGLGGTGILQIEWCGDNTVALAWSEEVLMVGPFGDSLRYYYPSPVHLVPELDGLRIISTERHELVQKVSDDSTAVFLPGSLHPAAQLFDASETFFARQNAGAGPTSASGSAWRSSARGRGGVGLGTGSRINLPSAARADDVIRAIRSGAPIVTGADGIARITLDGDASARPTRKGEENLSDAVDTCLRAAVCEWEVGWQRRLVKAAAFGKAFLDMYDPAFFVTTAKTLRVLNAARAYEIGLPISAEEYSAPAPLASLPHLTGPSALIARLTARNQHLLSSRIAELLSLRPDAILKHWARAKISKPLPTVAALGMAAQSSNGGGPSSSVVAGAADRADEEVTEAIVRKFEGMWSEGVSVSYAEIARVAWGMGRTRLATKLLEYEPRAVDQVPLLLNMHEDKLALIKAIESGDTDLVYHVLLRLKSQLSRGDFFRIIQAPLSDSLIPSGQQQAANTGTASSLLSVPNRLGASLGVGSAAMAASRYALSAQQPTQYLSLASNLVEVYAREQDRELLRDYYYQDDRRTESALLVLEEAEREARLRAIRRAAKVGPAAAGLSDDQGLQDRIFKLKSAQKFFAEDKERALEAKLIEEQSRLLGFQAALEAEDGGGGQHRYIGLSVNETIRQCLLQGMMRKAEKLRTDWKVPDKRWWQLRVDALASNRDWEGLWAFGEYLAKSSVARPAVKRDQKFDSSPALFHRAALSKKSPIGYEPFVSRLVAMGETDEAVRYVTRCMQDKTDKSRLM
ncbi:Vacuolar protein sorting-associated protein 16 [Tilletia horrida]|uniref:Vacuolar protein sorting-associated protein 16 n=1 Tax=Tilletia horrida TaxID=155126 RepID=A0AAN6JMD0_9BASI|nr:Vacuolar protein sorting-associated protein 16 [Tilletia horrida]